MPACIAWGQLHTATSLPWLPLRAFTEMVRRLVGLGVQHQARYGLGGPVHEDLGQDLLVFLAAPERLGR